MFIDGLKPKEAVYPAAGDPPVTRTAYSSTFDGNCKASTMQVQIKRCNGFYVYYLKPTQKCPSAYCFGKTNLRLILNTDKIFQ